MTIYFRYDFANSSRAHLLIEAFRIRVSGNLNLRNVICCGDLHCMNEEFFPDTCADVLGCYPHMLKFGALLTDNKSVKTNDLLVTLCRIYLIIVDEIGSDGEVGLPMLNPMFGIPPMALGIESDFRQCWGFLR